MKNRTVQLASTVLIVALVMHGVVALAQQPSGLKVHDIMAEPSIAGMRPDGEKLAPDGRLCAYLWSARGREPRDLYVVPTTGGEAKLLARAVDEPQQARPSKTETRDETASDPRRETRVMQRDAVNEPRGESVSGIDWSPDNRRLLFSKSGDLYVVNASGDGTPRRLTRTAMPEANARWLADGRRILYQAGGNLFVQGVDESLLVQLTRESGGTQAPSARSITAAIPSDNGALVAYIVADTSKQRALIVPTYTGEFVTAPTVRRGWTEQHVEVVDTSGAQERPSAVKLPAAEEGSYIRGVRWLPNNSALIIDRIDRDTKRRQLFLATISTPASLQGVENPNGSATSATIKPQTATQLIDEEQDAKWIAPLSRIVEPSPRGDQLLFASERDGYSHLYVVPIKAMPLRVRSSDPLAKPRIMPAGSVRIVMPPWTGPAPSLSNARQLTRGQWEVNWAGWLPDGERIVYSSTEASTAERHFYRLNVSTGKTERLPTAPGMNIDPQLSKNGDVLLYEHSEWNVPSDLYSLRVHATASGAPQRLTNTVPVRFRQINWTKPEFITYPAKDGKIVRGRIYTPPGFNRSNSRAQKFPAVVFVHGAGYLQNVINGWNNYYREAMFHHLLVGRGYVVLDIDYRGSAGYGREWRTDVYNFLGGLDLQDHLDGIDYIVKNYAVDPKRVGMYGGSYGGFMAEMAAMRAPERIACAAALRPVADWRHYYATNPVYTTERLGRPDRNPEAYRRSSPIDYAEKLQRPLLILHGMVDDNVHVIDSVRLVQKLIELGKTDYFEVMFYPSENHAFTRPESWADEYERILRFFEAHLQSK